MPNPALLLTNDEQAVQVISQVLVEFGFAVERPANTPAAVKEIETRAVGVVLIDCDDVISGKLLLDTFRRSKANQGVPAIAIVSGRTGLPTAFRLGAEFVVSKPASLDQARQTIRTAVSRTARKEALPAPPASPQTPLLANAAAAGSGASVSEPAPAQAISSVSAKPGQPSAMRVSGSVGSPSAPVPAKVIDPPPAKSTTRASAPPSVPKIQSDDPILADLDDLENPGAFSRPAFTELKLKKDKPIFAFVIVLVLLVGAGGYAAFMMRPDFREIVLHAYAQARILIGKPLPQPPPAAAPRPVPVAAPQATPSPESSDAAPAPESLPEDPPTVPAGKPTPAAIPNAPSAPVAPAQIHPASTRANPQH
jgi:CheY-like chemotaxis protein